MKHKGTSSRSSKLYDTKVPHSPFHSRRQGTTYGVVSELVICSMTPWLGSANNLLMSSTMRCMRLCLNGQSSLTCKRACSKCSEFLCQSTRETIAWWMDWHNCIQECATSLLSNLLKLKHPKYHQNNHKEEGGGESTHLLKVVYCARPNDVRNAIVFGIGWANATSSSDKKLRRSRRQA